MRWKVASDLRFQAAISEPKTPSFCGISVDLAPSTRKLLAIAIVRFWCAKSRGQTQVSPFFYRMETQFFPGTNPACPWTTPEMKGGRLFLVDVSNIFYFCLLGEGGSLKRWGGRGGGIGSVLKIPGEGGVPGGGARGRERVCGELGNFGGWGLNCFCFRGRNVHQVFFLCVKRSGHVRPWRLSTGFFAFSPGSLCNLVRRAPQNLEKVAKNPVEKIAPNPVTSVAVMVFSALKRFRSQKRRG